MDEVAEVYELTWDALGEASRNLGLWSSRDKAKDAAVRILPEGLRGRVSWVEDRHSSRMKITGDFVMFALPKVTGRAVN